MGFYAFTAAIYALVVIVFMLLSVLGERWAFGAKPDVTLTITVDTSQAEASLAGLSALVVELNAKLKNLNEERQKHENTDHI